MGGEFEGPEYEIPETVNLGPEPAVGDKRPREEESDAPEEAKRESSAPASNVNSDVTMRSSNTPTPSNGPSNNFGGVKLDALYIGELHWVCVSYYLVLYSCILKLDYFLLFLAPCSGRLMKISVKPA